jgi:hypothetical protein
MAKNTKAKGGAYEREICKQLSLWWSHGKDDDIFWRTASSGGRATQRSKKGKTTFGNHGDIQASNPIGQPLIDRIAIEIKRGYSKAQVGDLVDAAAAPKSSDFLGFIEQAHRSAKEAGVPYWMIIHKRDRREAMVYMPYSLWSAGINSEKFKYFFGAKLPSLRLYGGWIFGVRLNTFLKKVNPDDVKNL